eukprot:15453222-Alexandrium_andersonii.AAC.1
MDTNMNTDMDTDMDRDTDMDKDTDMHINTDTDMNTDMDTDTDVNTYMDTDTDIDTDTDMAERLRMATTCTAQFPKQPSTSTEETQAEYVKRKQTKQKYCRVTDFASQICVRLAASKRRPPNGL